MTPKLYIQLVIIFYLCLAVCWTVIAGAPSKETENACLREELMFGHIRKMADGTFSKNDLKACEDFLAEAISAARPRWLAILARYQIMMNHDPLAALVLVAPVLVGEDKARHWQAAQEEAEKKTAEGHAQSVFTETATPDKARPLQLKHQRPQRLLVPFPPVDEWLIDRVTAECAVEAARAHLALKEYETAMEQISYMGPKIEEFARVLAGECGGDLLLTMQRYEQAVRFYGYALQCLNDQCKVPLVVSIEVKESKRRTSLPRAMSEKKSGKKTADAGSFNYEETNDIHFARSLTDDEKYLQGRINESLDSATRLWDIERYGEDFVLYREAERMRREQGRYLEAYLAYKETENKYTGTMYGEAAFAYRIKCLWALSEPGNAEEARQTIQKTEERLKAKQKRLAAPRWKKFSAEAVQLLTNEIEEIGRKLDEMKKVPLNKAAAEEAGKETEQFIADNEFGLYRGEVMEAAADYYLEFLYDPEQAANWYNRALLWFDKAEKMSVDLDAFKVPEKSQAVSAPPPEMKAKDEWGNVDWAKMDSGKLFNQRTSTWYVPYHRMMAQTKKALCVFIMGKNKEALEMLNVILEVDNTERLNYEQGMPNSYSRLKAEFEQERMFATAEELKSFSGKARVAIMAADYYYEMEQWKEAAERYGRIDREMRKDLNLKARAYLDFMLGNCIVMTEHNADKALKYFGKFRQEYRNTPTWPRAMMAIFMAYQNKGEYDKALSTLKEIYRKMPKSEWGMRAYYHQGEFLYSRKQHEKAQEIFKTCLKQYADTWLARGSGQYLEKIKAAEE
ncbi:MAG: hypothetical protein Q7J98_09235 [Kiritimatiellia bacterium]|nr:hypothetical protein [Kiritimatiellia bacterium]